MLDRISTRTLTAGLIAVTFLVIAIGGVIRIYDAGESCPDWPTCFGSWSFDISPDEQESWWNENPDEIDSRGEYHRYTTFQIFTEWAHRFIAGTILGPLVLLNWFLVRRDEESNTTTKLAATVSVSLIVWQGLIGWFTVEMDNEHWSVALHLASALAFEMSLIWLWLCISQGTHETPKWIEFDPVLANRWKKRIGWLGFGSFIALFAGVFVATTPGANTGCGVNGLDSWPLCHGKLFNTIENLEDQSQIIHRWIVAIVGITLLASSWLVMKEQDQHQHGQILRNWIWTATSLFLLNIVVGAFYIFSWTAESEFEEWFSLLHLLLASLTFLVLATVWISTSIGTLHDTGVETLE
jgi:cytochrome c oxidase assembly protein subunit 15